MPDLITPSVKYLALDPGKTTGWATFDAEGIGVAYGQANIKELYELLGSTEATVFIVEDFELFPWKSKDMPFDTLVACRIIGAIDYAASLKNAEVILQKPTIKTIGYKWAGITKPSNHTISHGPDAYVHGVYYLQKNNIRVPQQGRVTNEG